MKNRHLFISVSLSSAHKQLLLVNAIKTAALAEGASPVAVILDSPERHNIQIFEGTPAGPAAAKVQDDGRIVGADFAACGIGAFYASELSIVPRCAELIESLYQAIAASSHLRHHFESQTFSNLKPRFARMGIFRKAAPEVTQAMAYLVEEIALKLSLYESNSIVGEFLPKREMPLVDDLLAGRYGANYALKRSIVRIELGSPRRVVVHNSS